MSNQPPDPNAPHTPAWPTPRQPAAPTPPPPPAAPVPGTPPPPPAPVPGPPPPPPGATPPPPGAVPPPGATPPPPPAAGVGGPPTGPGGPPAGGPAAPKAKSGAPLLLGAIGAVVLLIVVVVVGVVVLGGGDDDEEGGGGGGGGGTTEQDGGGEGEARAELAQALVDGDTDAVTRIVGATPAVAEPSSTVTRGDTADVTLGAEGYAAVGLDVEAGEQFTVTARSAEEQEIGGLVLDPDGALVAEITEPLETSAAGEHLLLVYSLDGEPGDITVTVGGFTEDVASPDGAAEGEIETAGDIVEFEIELEEQARYSLTLDEGFVLSARDDAGEPYPVGVLDAVSYQLDTTGAGTYRLRVGAEEDGRTGAFTLIIQRVPDFEVTNLVDGVDTGDGFFYDWNTPELAETRLGRFKVSVRGGVTVRVTASAAGGADLLLTLVERGEDDIVIDDGGPDEGEVYDYTADGFRNVEFRVEIANGAPARVDIEVERVLE